MAVAVEALHFGDLGIALRTLASGCGVCGSKAGVPGLQMVQAGSHLDSPEPLLQTRWDCNK